VSHQQPWRHWLLISEHGVCWCLIGHGATGCSSAGMATAGCSSSGHGVCECLIRGHGACGCHRPGHGVCECLISGALAPRGVSSRLGAWRLQMSHQRAWRLLAAISGHGVCWSHRLSMAPAGCSSAGGDCWLLISRHGACE
jgi:hypothetical protein